MTEGRLETESRCRECLAIIKGEVTSNNLSKRRVRTRTPDCLTIVICVIIKVQYLVSEVF